MVLWSPTDSFECGNYLRDVPEIDPIIKYSLLKGTNVKKLFHPTELSS